MSPDSSVLNRIVLAALALSAMTGCYSPAKPLPPALNEAISWAAEAEAAFRDGRHAAAQQGYKNALDLHIAAGNIPGVVRNLVNLAVVQHTSGQNAAARQSLTALDRHLTANHSSLRLDSETRALVAEAGWLKAHMCIDEGRLTEAQKEIDRLGSSSGNARLLNLRARLLLAQKQPAGALASARKAWGVAKGDASELGDAARYQARALEQLGQASEAARWYQTAVPIDQNAFRTHLVADDWLGLARTTHQTGSTEQARHFARLALDAAKRAGDSSRQREAQTLLRTP
jgi:tetratricopeptide (TPR) repeat protein